jgi:phage terminase Nu1 subunit (DNA packaging protein)
MQITHVPEAPRLVNTADMARTAGISTRLLFDWRQNGCPHIQCGAKILFDPSEVIAWAKTKYAATRKSA